MKRYASPSSLLQVAEQVDDLRPGSTRRGCSPARRAPASLGDERERTGDRDALQLTAGELARVAVAVLGARAPPVRSSSATRSSRPCSRQVEVVCASARPCCRRSSPAGRTTSTGPGTRAACRGAASRISRVGELGDVGPSKRDRAARWDRAAAAARGRGSTCPSPTRRRARPSGRAAIARSTPSTARTWPTVRRSTPRRIGKCLRDAGASTSERAGRGRRRRRSRRHWAPSSVSSSTRMQRARVAVADRRAARPARGRALGRSRTGTAGGSGSRSASRRRSGTTPGIDANRSPCRARPAASPRAALRCTGAAGARTASSTVASSTTWPAYITTTRSQRSATTPRSWVTKITAIPSSRLERSQQVEDLRLHGHVERGRRLVGDEQAAARTTSAIAIIAALAHAARELVRVVVEPRARGRGCRRSSSSSTARAARAALAHRPGAARIAVDELVADGERRVEARHRVLEDHGDLVAAQRAHARRSRERSRSRPSNGSPTRRRCGPAATARSRITASDVTVLPEPDSPTSPTISPARRRSDTSSTTGARPASVSELDRRGPSTASSAVARRAGGAVRRPWRARRSVRPSRPLRAACRWAARGRTRRAGRRRRVEREHGEHDRHARDEHLPRVR